MRRTLDLINKRTVEFSTLVVVEAGPEPIAEISANALTQLFVSKSPDGRTPLNGSLELTARCNLTCQHCYINEPANDRVARSKELTTDQLRRIIDEIVAEGGLFLTLTGGEVMLRPDFWEIYLYARQQGLLVTIFTNATLVTTKIADFLAEYPPIALEISIYGYTQETYEAVTGIKGSHAKFMRGIKLLHERGLNMVIKTVVMTLNQHEFEDMKRFAQSLGARFGYDTAIFARLDGGKQPCGLRVNSEKVVELDLADPTNACEISEAFESQAEAVKSDDLYRCGAGLNTWHITAYGEMAVCTISKTVDYNLKEGHFGEAWNGPIKEMRQRKKSEVFSKCRTCQVKEYCMLCPAKATLESGNPEFHIEFFCSAAELRAQVLGGKRQPITLVEKSSLTFLNETNEVTTGCSCH